MMMTFHLMQWFLFKHDDLISCKYFMTFYDDFGWL